MPSPPSRPAALAAFALGLGRGVLGRLPGLVADRRQRRLLAEMGRFVRGLPAALQAPLAPALDRLTPDPDSPDAAVAPIGEATVRRLADLAAALARGTGLGYCLRRSLVRFHFLRRAGVPLVVHFGARLPAQSGGGTLATGRRLAAHAWLTRDGSPYHEAEAHVRGWTEVYRWPPAAG